MADARLTVTNGARITLRASETPSAALNVGNVNYEGGVRDYEALRNKPRIEEVELVGNRTMAELGVRKIGNAAILDLF